MRTYHNGLAIGASDAGRGGLVATFGRLEDSRIPQLRDFSRHLPPPTEGATKNPAIADGAGECFVGRWIGTIKPPCFSLAGFVRL